MSTEPPIPQPTLYKRRGIRWSFRGKSPLSANAPTRLGWCSECERLSSVIRNLFQKYDFLDLNALLITTSDAEGMDVLAPCIGKISGGSECEERHDVLTEKIRTKGPPDEHNRWYQERHK